MAKINRQFACVVLVWLMAFWGIGDVFASSQTEVWAVGLRGGIYHWDGQQWSQCASPTTNMIYDIHMLSKTDGWAVGQDVLRWDGISWSMEESPPCYLKRSVYALSSNEVWVIGNCQPVPSVFKWNGSNWTQIPIPIDRLVGSDSNSVYSLSANDVWVSVSGVVDGRYKVFMLRWNGSQWQVWEMPIFDWVYDIKMVSSTKGFVHADESLWEWDGSFWTLVFEFEPSIDWGGSFLIPGDDRVWMARPYYDYNGEYDFALESLYMWDGKNMSHLATASPPHGVELSDCAVTDLFMESPTSGWIAAYEYSDDDFGRILYWDGSSLREVFRTPEPLIAISGVVGNIDEIEVTVEYKPETLNFKSKGRWITAYIELPEDYDADMIDITTVKIVKIDGIVLYTPIFAETSPTDIGDYDHDDLPDIAVKFSRKELIKHLSSGDCSITIAGRLMDQTGFQGVDIIRVIR
jgi:hypothetical protein